MFVFGVLERAKLVNLTTSSSLTNLSVCSILNVDLSTVVIIIWTSVTDRQFCSLKSNRSDRTGGVKRDYI